MIAIPHDVAASCASAGIGLAGVVTQVRSNRRIAAETAARRDAERRLDASHVAEVAGDARSLALIHAAQDVSAGLIADLRAECDRRADRIQELELRLRSCEENNQAMPGERRRDDTRDLLTYRE